MKCKCGKEATIHWDGTGHDYYGDYCEECFNVVYKGVFSKKTYN